MTKLDLHEAASDLVAVVDGALGVVSVGAVKVDASAGGAHRNRLVFGKDFTKVTTPGTRAGGVLAVVPVAPIGDSPIHTMKKTPKKPLRSANKGRNQTHAAKAGRSSSRSAIAEKSSRADND